MRFLLSLLILLGISTSWADWSYVGIGATIQKTDKKIFVIADLIPNGPAEKAGVKVGEIVKAVDGQTTEGLNLKKLVKKIQGPVDTAVILTLGCPESCQERDVRIVREVIYMKCFMEGMINLHMTGNDQQGQVYGTIGQDSIMLNISSGTAYGTFKNEPLQLTVKPYFGNMNLFSFEGMIHSQWVHWTPDLIDTQTCIQ